MYGQMTAGSWIYIGTQGIVQGTFQTFAALAEKRYDGTLRRHDRPHRRARRDGRRAAAGRHDERRRRALPRRRPHRIDKRLETRYLDVRHADLDRRDRAGPQAATSDAACPSACVANAAEALPALLARGRAVRRRHRPDLGPRPAAATSPPGRAYDDWERERTRGPARVRRARPASMVEHCARWSGSRTPAPRSSTTATTCAARPARAARPGLRLPRLRAGLHPPAVLRGQGAVPLGRAVRRPRGHRRRRPTRSLRAFPRQRRCRPALDRHGPRARAFQGLPARICWLGYGERAKAGAEVQRDGGPRRDDGAGRDRPRPPRLRLGRLALPRDRVDARRLRRDRRLADPQRAAQRRVGRRLGGGAPRRRRRHGQVASTPARSSPTAPSSPPRIERVLTNDPGMGVVRHADAGYDRAIEVAEERDVRIPMRG